MPPEAASDVPKKLSPHRARPTTPRTERVARLSCSRKDLCKQDGTDMTVTSTKTEKRAREVIELQVAEDAHAITLVWYTKEDGYMKQADHGAKATATQRSNTIKS